MSALGLFNATANLSLSKRESLQQANGFSASTVVPYSSRVYVEKMQCSGQSSELVRILVNDRVIQLQNCGADNLGRCKLLSFIDSLSFAKQGGLWDQCFVGTSSAPVKKNSSSLSIQPAQFTGDASVIATGLGLVGFVIVWFNILAVVSF